MGKEQNLYGNNTWTGGPHYGGLVIRGLGICYFDYSRTRKEKKTENYDGINTLLY